MQRRPAESRRGVTGRRPGLIAVIVQGEPWTSAARPRKGEGRRTRIPASPPPSAFGGAEVPQASNYLWAQLMRRSFPPSLDLGGTPSFGETSPERFARRRVASTCWSVAAVAGDSGSWRSSRTERWLAGSWHICACRRRCHGHARRAPLHVERPLVLRTPTHCSTSPDRRWVRPAFGGSWVVVGAVSLSGDTPRRPPRC